MRESTRVISLLILSAACAGPGADRTWTLDAAPLVHLGSASDTGVTQFANVYSAAMFPSEHIAVLDGDSQQIRVFAGDGRFVRTLGRRGNGPGEFQNASYLRSLPSDSLFVVDLVTGRVTVYDSIGLVGRSVSLPPGLMGTTFPLAPLRDEAVLAMRVRFPGIAGGGARAQLTKTLFRLKPLPGTLDSLGTFPSSSMKSWEQGANKGWQPLLGGGEERVAATTAHVFISSPTTWRIDVWDIASGRWSKIVEPIGPVVTRPADRDSLHAELTARGMAPAAAARMDVADTLPIIHDLLPVSDADEVAVLEGTRAGRWSGDIAIYAASGTRLGVVRVDPSWKPLAVTNSRLLVVTRDVDGRESVEVYRYTRGRTVARRP